MGRAEVGVVAVGAVDTVADGADEFVRAEEADNAGARRGGVLGGIVTVIRGRLLLVTAARPLPT